MPSRNVKISRAAARLGRVARTRGSSNALSIHAAFDPRGRMADGLIGAVGAMALLAWARGERRLGGNDLAVQAGDREQPLSEQRASDRRARQRLRLHRTRETRENPAGRLLLRLPDREQPVHREREPEIDPEETQIAIDQASRFSQVCKVYAPIYPQLTIPAINTPGSITREGSPRPTSACYGVRGIPRRATTKAGASC